MSGSRYKADAERKASLCPVVTRSRLFDPVQVDTFFGYNAGLTSYAFAHFSVLIATLGDAIGELDGSPVIATETGCTAVDALVIGACSS